MNEPTSREYSNGNGNGRAHAQHAQHAQHHEESSSLGLMSQLTREMTGLFSKELALAKSEVTHAMNAAKAGAASVASGGLVLFGGFLVLLWAAVLGLSEVLAPWLAAVIVGGVVALIGFGMLQAGKKKLEPSAFEPKRTEHQMHKDRDAAKGVMQ